jgi:hypothetical protein
VVTIEPLDAEVYRWSGPETTIRLVDRELTLLGFV